MRFFRYLFSLPSAPLPGSDCWENHSPATPAAQLSGSWHQNCAGLFVWLFLATLVFWPGEKAYEWLLVSKIKNESKGVGNIFIHLKPATTDFCSSISFRADHVRGHARSLAKKIVDCSSSTQNHRQVKNGKNQRRTFTPFGGDVGIDLGGVVWQHLG
jgi:hypothetical protein